MPIISVYIFLQKCYQNWYIFYLMVLIFKTEDFKCQKKICALNEEGTVTDETCQNWFTKFHTENFLLNNTL